MTDLLTPPPTVPATFERQPLGSDELRAHQERILAMPEERYSLAARLLFWTTRRAFPQGASFEFFAFVELVARVPYMAWEHVAHIAQTQNHRDHAFDRRIQDRVVLARAEQDNEFWHLLIMEEFLDRSGYEPHWFRDRVFPQLLSLVYYQLAWLLYVCSPAWSYRLNRDFEDHAMRQYARFVADHPELDDERWESAYADDYGHHETVGDLLRQIALDEEEHKAHSASALRTGPRFSRRA